jgi:hypothetical protein
MVHHMGAEVEILTIRIPVGLERRGGRTLTVSGRDHEMLTIRIHLRDFVDETPVEDAAVAVNLFMVLRSTVG